MAEGLIIDRIGGPQFYYALACFCGNSWVNTKKEAGYPWVLLFWDYDVALDALDEALPGPYTCECGHQIRVREKTYGEAIARCLDRNMGGVMVVGELDREIVYENR